MSFEALIEDWRLIGRDEGEMKIGVGHSRLNKTVVNVH